MLNIPLLISEQYIFCFLNVYFENRKVLYRLFAIHTIDDKYNNDLLYFDFQCNSRILQELSPLHLIE